MNEESSADTVALDNEQAGRLAALHLIGLGHAHILIAASSLSLANIRQRCSGAAEALRSHGLPAPDIVELGFDVESATQRLSQWLASHPAPTAIQALTNYTTLAALSSLAERRLRLPQDVSLVGFDDYPWMRARSVPLTALAQPVREMGRLLWERLAARIKGDASPAVHIRLPGELKPRDSTAAPPRARLVCVRNAGS